MLATGLWNAMHSESAITEAMAESAKPSEIRSRPEHGSIVATKEGEKQGPQEQIQSHNPKCQRPQEAAASSKT